MANESLKTILIKAGSLLAIIWSMIHAHDGHSAELGKYSRVRTLDAIVKAAELVEVPTALVLAVCWHEGWGLNDAKRGKAVLNKPDGATYSYGICQVKLETAQYLDARFKHRTKATPDRLKTDFVNAFYAAKYLKVQLAEYDGDWRLAIDAYNKGSNPKANTEYVRRVMVAMERFEDFGTELAK